MVFFCDLNVLARKLASPFGHPTQVSRQGQLAATYDYFGVRLARALVLAMTLSKNIYVRRHLYVCRQNYCLSVGFTTT